MKIKIPFQISSYLIKLKPIWRHHYFIVAVALFSGVAYAVYVVNITLSTPTDSHYFDQQLHNTIGSKFNQSTKDTIEKIEQLQTSSDASNPDDPFPGGRINPFAE